MIPQKKPLTFDQKETQIVYHASKEIHIYRVTEDEIEKLSHSAGSIELACWTSALSASLVFFSAYITRTENDLIKGVFLVFSICLFVMMVYFIYRWKVYLNYHKNLVEEIKTMPCLE